MAAACGYSSSSTVVILLLLRSSGATSLRLMAHDGRSYGYDRGHYHIVRPER